MSNPIRGTITRAIKGEQMEFRLAAHEWCELEEELGKPMAAILRDFSEGMNNETISMAFLRSVFRAALSRCKPGLTHEAAGKIISTISLKAAAIIVGQTINASLPQADPAQDEAPGSQKSGKGEESRPLDWLNLYRAWVEAGQRPGDFWDMTLRDIMVVFRACQDRRLFEHDQRAWLAHTTAYLTVYAPQKSKEFPKLKAIESKKPDAPTRAAKSDWRDMLEKARAWVRGKA